MYALFKLLHLLAVVGLLGNAFTGLFWKAHGDRTGDPRIIAHVLAGIIRSDRWFSWPAVLFITASGLAGAFRVGLKPLGTPWLFLSILCFALSGLAFGLGASPAQHRLFALADGATEASFDRAAYRSLSRRWLYSGLLATGSLLAATALMVLKPAR